MVKGDQVKKYVKAIMPTPALKAARGLRYLIALSELDHDKGLQTLLTLSELDHDKGLQTLLALSKLDHDKGLQTLLALSELEDQAMTSLIERAENLKRYYPSATSFEEVALAHKADARTISNSLDLGCGEDPRNPFGASMVFGVDIRNDLPKTIRQADLSAEPVPFGDSEFDFCTAFDVIEHIPRIAWKNGNARLGFIELMNEVHRVLKPGGIFLHSTPAFPAKQAFQDPTHVNIITEDTMPFYFCEPHSWARRLGYGFRGKFELIEQRWSKGIFLIGTMRAIK